MRKMLASVLALVVLLVLSEAGLCTKPGPPKLPPKGGGTVINNTYCPKTLANAWAKAFAVAVSENSLSVNQDRPYTAPPDAALHWSNVPEFSKINRLGEQDYGELKSGDYDVKYFNTADYKTIEVLDIDKYERWGWLLGKRIDNCEVEKRILKKYRKFAAKHKDTKFVVCVDIEGHPTTKLTNIGLGGGSSGNPAEMIGVSSVVNANQQTSEAKRRVVIKYKLCEKKNK